ncbi:MAG TPA: LLM class flavin-dependent oxidoreductase [Candidatus Binatia bacterium]|nr:LLM class flavin-dependent oxidoreductase [Candidatus Binatia bacterium]
MIRFGVFDHLDRNALPLADFYQQRLELVELYDRAGFYGYHVAEHHGTPLGMAPSPSLFLAAVARQTRRVRFGPMVYLLPLYHPIRLAEEIAMLDQLGRGRLDVGVGRGRSPIELASFGCDPSEAEAIFDEAFEVVRSALTDGRVTFAGRYFNYDDVEVATRPLQSPHPPFWYGIGSLENVDRCVARGFNVVTLVESAHAAEIAQRFRAAAAEAGMDHLLMGICRFVVVADTTREALAIARRAYAYWYKSFNHLFALHGIRPVRPWPDTFDAMSRAGLAFAGSPDAVADALRSQLAEVGANYCVGQLVFGDMSFEESRRSIELFTDSVMPAIQGELSPA